MLQDTEDIIIIYNVGAVKSGNISAVVNGMIYASRSILIRFVRGTIPNEINVGGAKMIE